MDVFGRGAVRELKVVRVEVVLQDLAVNGGDQKGSTEGEENGL